MSTEKDTLEGLKFDDVIAWCGGFLDAGFVRLSKLKILDVPCRSVPPERLYEALRADGVDLDRGGDGQDDLVNRD